jgi:hypothetical protein
MSETNGSNLPVVAQNYNAMTMSKEELVEVIVENTGGILSRLDLPTVRVPTAGGTMWTIPDVEAGDRSDKVLRGIVVYQTVARGYWEESFDNSGGGTPPTCYSNDGKRGVGNPGGDCSICPLMKFCVTNQESVL